jgi:glycosyltransferase involved in cell wall biosynthesis
MKILFLSRLYNPHMGGVEKHIEMLSKTLIKKGHKITIITTKFENRLPDKETISGINVLRFTQPKIKYIGLLFTWYWMIKNLDLFRENDVVHIHDVFIWYWPIRLLLPLKKIYVTFHGQWGNYPIHLIDKLQKKIAYWFSNGNICIGEYIPKYYGIKADSISYGATSNPKDLLISKANKNILYVGRLDPEVPVLKIFRVFSNLKNFNIQILGDGILKKDAEKYGKVYGFIDPSQYYKKAKYVFASGYLTILEALINKCLVFVTYENVLQKDYYELSPFSKLIICESDIKRLLSKFSFYLSHNKDTNGLIKKGYNWAKNQTWNLMTEKYLKLWQN